MMCLKIQQVHLFSLKSIELLLCAKKEDIEIKLLSFPTPCNQSFARKTIFILQCDKNHKREVTTDMWQHREQYIFICLFFQIIFSSSNGSSVLIMIAILLCLQNKMGKCVFFNLIIFSLRVIIVCVLFLTYQLSSVVFYNMNYFLEKF